jgi:PAS domain S-box-containing protein
MSGTKFQIADLSDPRLAVHALSPMPVWLWSADATRIIWANPTAAAIFNAPSPAAVSDIRFESTHSASAQVARLVGTLPLGGAARLERLRGFGASVGGALTCFCSRFPMSDNSEAVLIVSSERAGPDIALVDRARRLVADGADAAVFSADGELIEAAETARAKLGTTTNLTALGAEKLAREATLNGAAEGDIPAGRISLRRLGAGSTIALLLNFIEATIVPTAAVGDLRPLRRATDAAPTPAPTTPPPDAPRRSTLRFVWQMDVANRFTIEPDRFTRLVGARTGALLGRPWADIADALKLDPKGEVARALETRNTWSGVVLSWPIDGASERLAVEMSGLPAFDRDRQFVGYRGFGVCRDIDRIAAHTSRPVAEAISAQMAGANVLPFPAPKPPEAALSPSEQTAFQEIGRELSDRLKGAAGKDVPEQMADDFGPEIIAPQPQTAPPPEPPRAARNGDAARDTGEGRPILDRLPVGILVYRLNNLIYANRAFLDWTGYPSLNALEEAGGLDSLFIETKAEPGSKNGGRTSGRTLTISTPNGDQMPLEGRLFSIAWNGENALVLILNANTPAAGSAVPNKEAEAALSRAENENRELKAILDTATDGVLVLDRNGRILSANRSAQALFGYGARDFSLLTLGELFAPESRRAATDYLDRMAQDNASVVNEGRDLIGRVNKGGLVPLYMTIGRIESGDKFCAVLRDMTAWKRTEEELINARQQAEKQSSAKSEFLAKISHEIRTPLNAIIGFSEVMIEERFGAVGNDRYRQYLKDIHTSGGHLISLLNDLLDLSKIEAGKLELTFVTVNLNDLVQQCVAIMQEQANRERVIIRSSLNPNLPAVVADARSVRQIALNLLSNSIKFTGPGGQVIVSTALTSAAEVALRVRDTGTGMSEQELQTALEPFRQLSTSTRYASNGTGLGLPITKALAEANHARFRIVSEVASGTLVEITFPATKVLAQ